MNIDTYGSNLSSDVLNLFSENLACLDLKNNEVHSFSCEVLVGIFAIVSIEKSLFRLA
jgi:hypothetical protein